ncbi:MAG: WD40/YVTN/BNR-like repeat-containing protein, partial [Alphaproteobacteria bacterium]
SKALLAALLSALLLGVLTSSALAGVGSWSTTGPQGATIRTIAFDPSNPSRAWVGVGTRAAQSSGLLFKSLDGGLTWSAASSGLPDVSIEAIAFDPASPSTVWIGTDGEGIFRSTDGGATWAARSGGLDVPFVRDIAIDPTAASTLYAGTDQGVYKSTDAGASWQVVGDGLMLELVINDVAVNPITPAIVYAATAEGIYRSANAGVSWTVMANTDPKNMLSVAIDPVTPTTLYATDDEGNAWRIKQGASWATRNNGLGTNPGANFVALDPSNPSIAWLGESGGVFKATDAAGTLTWAAASTGLPVGTNVGTLAVRAGSQVLIGGDTFGDGLYRTANAGVSWARSNTGLVASDVGAVVVDPSAPRATGGAFAGTFFAGVFSTVDGAASWTRNQVARYVKILSLAIDP